jgi:nuclear transport factor 2 (NTF2) superfamily protein
MQQETPRPPLPPFSYEDAVIKVRKAEDAWNTKNPGAIALAYSPDSSWRNRDEIFQGRAAIVEFLERKWLKEQEYRLIKEIWTYGDNRIAVRFAYEWHNQHDQWFRSYGNENWEFDDNGLMKARHASINDKSINADERKFLWPEGVRPDDYHSLTELDL